MQYSACDGTIFQHHVVQSFYDGEPPEDSDLSSVPHWRVDEEFFLRDLDWGCIRIPDAEKVVWNKLNKDKSLEITFAYRLQSRPQASVTDAWSSWLIPASGLMRMREAFSGEGFEAGFEADLFSKHSKLNFVVHRNLEYILSVVFLWFGNRAERTTME